MQRKKFSVLLTTLVALTASSSLFVARGAEPFQIDANFPGGNVVVDSISDSGAVKLRPDLRDTQGDWFYTAFRVTGASGKRATFEYDAPNRIGPRGPAVSVDGGKTWRYLSPTPDADSQRFAYQFGADENETYFALAPLYTRKNWLEFVAKYQARQEFKLGTLCQARDGSDVDMLELVSSSDAPRYGVALTARCHCCEMIADFVLEGWIDEIESETEEGRWLRANCDFLVVPFVDQPGVEAGDQGKNRKPHDHNRDFAQEIYPSVRALKKKIVDDFADRPLVFLDWHCPWIRGIPDNEKVYAPATANEKMSQALREYSALLEREQSGKTLPYRESNNLPFGQSWNVKSNYERPAGEPPTLSSKHWAETLPNILFSGGFEIPYANAQGVEVTPNAAREFGRSAAKALCRFLQAREKKDVAN